jgi:tripeptidyl-peptidase I
VLFRSITMFALSKLFALLFVVVHASATLVFHEGRAEPPSGFVSTGPAPADQSITLRVALTSNNIAGLENKLNSISTPGSKEFRQWLSAGVLPGYI